MKRFFVFLLIMLMCCTVLPSISASASTVNESWLWPVKGIYGIGSNYGLRDLDGNGTLEDDHKGIDINNYGSTVGSASGQPVRAAKSGTIYSAVNTVADNTFISGSFGNCVRIDHGDGTYSLYAHLKPGGVKTSGTVKQGDVIGYIGNTGNSYGAHLHFQIYTNKNNVNGSTLNPMPTNSEISIKNTYKLPSGWPSEKITYIFEPCDHTTDSGQNAFENKDDQYGVCSLCGYVYDWRSTFNTAEAGKYQVTKSGGTTLRRPAPYEDATASLTVKSGSTVEVLGSWINAYGNKWYRVIIDGTHYCGYSGHFQFVSYSAFSVSLSGFAPANNATIPKATYNLTGTVTTNNYPLKSIEAYLDGTKYATWTAPDKTTMSVNLKDTAINKNLKFASLSTGKHTIVLKAYNYTNGALVQFHSSVFTIENTACTHSYSYKATKNPTTSATGTLTGTCSKCAGTKTVTLPKLTTTDYTYKVTKAATCTATGTGRYTWKTTTYGSFYFDVSISSTGHSFSYAVTKKPTLSATGTLTGTCSKCSNAWKYVTLPKLTTTDYTYKVTKAVTCTATGTGRYTWKTTTYGSFYFDATLVETGHSWSSATCTTPKTCNACGATSGSALGHSYNSGVVTKAATCTAEGVMTYTCTRCSATKTEKIVANGHLWKIATCTAPETCSKCGESKASALGHKYNSGVVTIAATCTAAGEKTYTCTRCGGTKAEPIAKLTTHTYDNECDTICNICEQTRTVPHQYSAAWFLDRENHWYECIACGSKKGHAAHTPGAVATDSTAQTCTVCNYIITPALGHTHRYATDLTADRIGHWYACDGCAEKKAYAEHCWDNACDTDCNDCGYARAITHDYSPMWSMNETGHWNECTVCTAKANEEGHVPGMEATSDTAQTCVVCGYEIAPALGTTETTSPATQPTTQPSVENTVPVAVDKDEEQNNENETPIWIPVLVIVVATVLISTIVTVIVLKRKVQQKT